MKLVPLRSALTRYRPMSWCDMGHPVFVSERLPQVDTANPGHAIVDFLKPSVIILAFNSVDTLGATLAQAREISDDIHVVDSFSTDDTVALSRQHGALVVQHAFENYGAQRNWAIDHLASRYPGSCTWMPMSGLLLN